jgi:hypothetical protein
MKSQYGGIQAMTFHGVTTVVNKTDKQLVFQVGGGTHFRVDPGDIIQFPDNSIPTPPFVNRPEIWITGVEDAERAA